MSFLLSPKLWAYGVPFAITAAVFLWVVADASTFPQAANASTSVASDAQVMDENPFRSLPYGDPYYKGANSIEWGNGLRNKADEFLKDNFSRIAEIIGMKEPGSVTQVFVDLDEDGKILKIEYFIDIDRNGTPDYVAEVTKGQVFKGEIEIEPYESRNASTPRSLHLKPDQTRQLNEQLKEIGKELISDLKQQRVLVEAEGGRGFILTQSLSLALGKKSYAPT